MKVLMAAKNVTALFALTASTGALAGGDAATKPAGNEAIIRVGQDAVSLYLEPQATATNSAQLGLIYNDDDDITVLNGGLFANGDRQEIKGRLGGKFFYANLDGDSGYGVALGGEATVVLNSDISITGGLFLSPSSLSFSEVDGYEEWYVKARFQLFENGAVAAGVGSFQLEPERGRDFELDDGLFLEMILKY